MKEIKWDKEKGASFEGRNGMGICTGVEVWHKERENFICIQPITSRGRHARCLIDIPTEALPELFDAIKSLVYVRHTRPTIEWCWEDVRELRPGWTEEQCEEGLQSIQKYLVDRSVELGWEVMADLLDSEELEDEDNDEDDDAQEEPGWDAHQNGLDWEKRLAEIMAEKLKEKSV